MASDFIVDGRPDPDTKSEILEALIADAKNYWGDDLNDTQQSILREFYDPIADRLAQAQEDIGLVLDSAQIDHATEAALDLLTALIGVPRKPAEKSTGTVTFSRSTSADVDYTIPKGTIVQTDSTDPIKFETTEAKNLATGTSSVDAPVAALVGGVEGNLGPNTLIIMPNPPAGVEEATNAADTTGGADEENDDELRERAKGELSEGTRASVPALINALRKVDGVTSVDVVENDTASTDGDGRPSHSVEPIVAGTFLNNEIAQSIYDTKAGGMPIVGGYAGTSTNGTATLPNGDSKTVTFSIATEVQIYVDVNLQHTSEYAGDTAVQDSIVTYIGGILSSGNEVVGLNVSDDVIYNKVMEAILSVGGVFDVTSLTIDTVDPPAGTSNITIADGSVATADATDGSITLTTTAV